MKRIHTLDQLVKLAHERRSVSWMGHRMPAAFVINMQAVRVWNLLQFGLYLYRPKSDFPSGAALVAGVAHNTHRSGKSR